MGSFELDNPYGINSTAMLMSGTSSGIAYNTTGPNDWVTNGSNIGSNNIEKYEDSSGLTWKTPTGITLVTLGSNVLSTRGKTAGTTRGTSMASKYLSSTKWGAKATPKGLFKAVPKRILGMPLRSPVLGRLAGRAVPIAGWALLAYDVGDYFYRAFKDIKNGALLDSRSAKCKSKFKK